MWIHFSTKGVFNFNIHGTYYVYEPVQFEAGTTVSVDLGNGKPDKEVGEEALGYSAHFWVHSNTNTEQRPDTTHWLTGDWKLSEVRKDSLSIPEKDWPGYLLGFTVDNGKCIARIGGSEYPANCSVLDPNGYSTLRISLLYRPQRGGADFYEIVYRTDNEIRLLISMIDYGVVTATYLKQK